MFRCVTGNSFKASAIIFVSLLTAGCGIFVDRGDEYLKSESIPTIEVPEDKDRSAVGQIYRIPETTNQSVVGDKNEVPRPLPLSETRFEETIKIQNFEDKSWILINKPPEEVWPRVRNILSRSSIPTTRVNARSGEMETAWLQFKDDENSHHRFRVIIESAMQLNSSEVKLLHNAAPLASLNDSVDWPEKSDSDLREKEMLDVIANALASDINSGTISLLAQSIGGESKVDLVTPKVADPYLVIKLPFERSWASIVYSLSHGGFSIKDQNKTAGTFDVEFSAKTAVEEEEDGFFKRWFSDENEEEVGNLYKVLLNQAENGVEVRIVDTDKSSLETGISSRLLKIIRSNLT